MKDGSWRQPVLLDPNLDGLCSDPFHSLPSTPTEQGRGTQPISGVDTPVPELQEEERWTLFYHGPNRYEWKVAGPPVSEPVEVVPAASRDALLEQLETAEKERDRWRATARGRHGRIADVAADYGLLPDRMDKIAAKFEADDDDADQLIADTWRDAANYVRHEARARPC